MIESLNTVNLIFLFLISSAAIWILGIKVTKVTDIIDNRFNIGQAFGGLILLAIVTNLAEVAIVIAAATSHQIGIAIGNILGGIAIQTVVLVLLDGFGLRNDGVLTFKPLSLKIVLEGLLVVFVLLVTILGAQLPKSIIFLRLTPGDIAIVISWVIGLWLIKKADVSLPWQKRIKHHETKKEIKNLKEIKTFYILFFFLFLAIATLVAGVILEESSKAIATKMGWSTTFFGATILAAVTALPEISTGLAAVKIRDYTLAISDIFGGNAFLPTLFLLATLLSGIPTLNQIQKSDVYLACLGAILTIIYLYGLIFSSKRLYFWLGIDSIVVLLTYVIGIGGLFFLKG